MSLSTEELTDVQRRVLAENFERIGPFFLGRDLHAMLDCACAPDLALTREAALGAQPVGLDVPLAVPFGAKLREEFFGGILFDRGAHAHYMVDGPAYAVLVEVASGPRTAREILGAASKDVTSAEVESTLKALVDRGILAQTQGKTPSAVELFPARDLTLGYLQSPIIVEVEVTYGCFRACRHCAYEASPDARTPDELSVDQWRDVFGKLADAGVLIVQLTGGDPLFRPDSFEIVEAADAAGLSVYIRSDTVALNKRNVERLKGLRNLWHVGTSIDGADADSHDWMRGRGAFEILAQRIGVLAADGVPVSAGATLHRENYRTVRTIGRRAVEFGAQWFDIGFLSPVGRAASMRDLVLDEHQVADSLRDYVEGVREGEYSPSHAHYARRAVSDEPFSDLGDLMSKLPYVTEWPFSRLRIDPKGSSYTAGKLKGSDYAGGFDLLDRDTAYVWDNSPNLRQLRELGAGGRIHSLDYRLLRSSHEFIGSN